MFGTALGSAQGGSSKPISFRREWRLSFSIFLSPVASTNVLLVTETIYSWKFHKKIEALFNNLRSFIKAHRYFGGLNSLPENQQAICVELKLLEATLFQEQLFTGWSSSGDQGNARSVDIHRQNWSHRHLRNLACLTSYLWIQFASFLFHFTKLF